MLAATLVVITPALAFANGTIDVSKGIATRRRRLAIRVAGIDDTRLDRSDRWCGPVALCAS